MSRVEEIEGQVNKLSGDELKGFRESFAEFDAAVWDRIWRSQIERHGRAWMAPPNLVHGRSFWRRLLLHHRCARWTDA